LVAVTDAGLFGASAAVAADANRDRLIAEIDARYLEAGAPAWRRVRQEIAAAGEMDLNGLARAVDGVGDPDLHLVSPADFSVLQAEIDGARVGTGLIEFGLEIRRGQPPRVVTPVAGSPAARAGLRPGDQLVAIDGRSGEDLDRPAVMRALRMAGPVELTVERGGCRRTVRLSPDPRPLVPVTTALVRSGKSLSGVVRIVQFTPGVAKQVADALARLDAAGVAGYVLDLRENPGGLLDQAEATARLFGAQELGALRRADGREEIVTSAVPPRPPKPLVVLIDRGTASAAEYVAAAVGQLPGARLAGARGAGRGQAQAYASLADGWGVVIPSARLIVRGRDIKADPPTPDASLPDRQLSAKEPPGEVLRLLRQLERNPVQT